jgi:hypothetical protein
MQTNAPVATTVAAPITVEEVQGLRARREELSNQLISAAGRRKALALELKSATGADRVGLEQRIGVLDDRMVQLESDIASTGRQLTSAPAGLLAGTGRGSAGQRMLSSDQTLAFSIVFTIFVFFPLAFSASRMMWRRASRPLSAPPLSHEAVQRLERLEHSVEAVAIEVERISEGQRFVTRLLSGGAQTPSLNALKETVGMPLPSRHE